MPDANKSVPSRSAPPRFEIVRASDLLKRAGRRPRPSLFTALFGAVRSVVEDAYVSLAQEVMVRGEQLGDARAERRHTKSVRAAERRRLRAQRSQARDAQGARTVAGPKTLH